ncbi:MAG: hypothetical protein GXY89_04740 [Tissierellia bacterium]|nr:hypothetical protein [Tissierellia bacterium]
MNKININELAKAANIEVNEKEEAIYLEQIRGVIDFIGEYKNPYKSSSKDRQVDFDELREDVPKKSLTSEEALMNTYKKKYSYFQVKEFVEQ